MECENRGVMKKLWLMMWAGGVLVLAAAVWAGTAQGAESGPMGLTDGPSSPIPGPGDGASAEPPEAEAAETLVLFLRALADDDFSKALFLTDIDGLRSYLLERRLADLKRANPSLAQKDLAEISSTFQMRELAPDRVKGILVQGWKANELKGMTWKIASWTPAPGGPDTGTIATVIASKANGEDQRIPFGLRKSPADGEWIIAPDILEKLTEGRPAAPQEVPMPDPVAKVVESFWTAWTAGKPDEAWALMSPAARARVSMEALAEHYAKVTGIYGAVESWKIEHVRQISADLLAIGLGLTTRTPTQSIMLFKLDPLKINWALEDVQFRAVQGGSGAPAMRPSASDRPTAPAPTPSSFAPSFKTDFKPDLGVPAR